MAVLDAAVAQAEVPGLIDRYRVGSSASFDALRAMAPHLTPWVPGLRAALEPGSDPERRERACLTLGLLGEAARPSVPALRSLLASDASTALRRAAGEALIRIDVDAAREASRALADADPELAEWLARRVLLSRL
ncbi:MAG: HEAT repeat domain-containing protein [Thermoanaerobaculia bacterium]|nr:HEAT repeat domain-containing protein [Thermoanaerobaculia bacterium]